MSVKGGEAMTLGKILTRSMGRPRIHKRKMTALNVLLKPVLEGRRVSDVANEWGLPRWVLDDVRQGKTKIPGGRYLQAIAAGLDRTVDDLLDEIAPAPAKRKVATA